MTKGEVVEAIAKEAGLTKADAERALNAFTDTVKKSLKKGKAVTLVGFGTFDISKRKARMGRNPQTGEAIKIAAATLPKFKAGKGLKDAVKKK
ncbi:MAG: HU family DNA-binding protein [Proteobacteria bacterium]|nr:HU family DNA-binding protein [Pseudomonadota bacterium]